MTITLEQASTVFLEMQGELKEKGVVTLFETHSRNREVKMLVEAQNSACFDDFVIMWQGQCICRTTVMEVAVFIFNLYGTRDVRL